MSASFKTAARLFLTLTVITGVIYPLVVTLAAQTLFPQQANGSLMYRGEKPVGSRLVGQFFDSPRYFWSRPSATQPVPYQALAGSGSNWGPTNPALREAVANRIGRLKALDPENQGPVPVDLVTASGSGLDPHISPAAAAYQAARVARFRNLPRERVEALIEQHTQPASLGFLGQERVCVLELNLALDTMAGHP